MALVVHKLGKPNVCLPPAWASLPRSFGKSDQADVSLALSFSCAFLVMTASRWYPEETCCWARLQLGWTGWLPACSSRHWEWIPLQCQGLKCSVTLRVVPVTKPQLDISKTGMAFVYPPWIQSSPQCHNRTSPQLGPGDFTGIKVPLPVV